MQAGLGVTVGQRFRDHIPLSPVLTGLVSLVVFPVLACDFPSDDDVIIPYGASATHDEMLAGQKTVKAHVAAVEEYLTCIRVEYTGAGNSPTPEQQKIWTARHNAAVDAMDSVAARFNEQLRIFKQNQRR